MWLTNMNLVKKGEQILLVQERWGSVREGRVPNHWVCVVLCASVSGGRMSQWGVLLKGVEYQVCRQVEVTMLLLVELSWSVVGSPAPSHPESVAEPVSLPCATWLACSGTKPAEPRKSSYTCSMPHRSQGAHVHNHIWARNVRVIALTCTRASVKLIFMANSSLMNTSGYRVFSKAASNSSSC